MFGHLNVKFSPEADPAYRVVSVKDKSGGDQGNAHRVHGLSKPIEPAMGYLGWEGALH